MYIIINKHSIVKTDNQIKHNFFVKICIILIKNQHINDLFPLNTYETAIKLLIEIQSQKSIKQTELILHLID